MKKSLYKKILNFFKKIDWKFLEKVFMIIGIILPIIISLFSLYYVVNPPLHKGKNINSINYIYKSYENIALDYESVDKDIILADFGVPRIIPFISRIIPPIMNEYMENEEYKQIEGNCYNLEDTSICFIFNEEKKYIGMSLTGKGIKVPGLYTNYKKNKILKLGEFSVNDLLSIGIINKKDITYFVGADHGGATLFQIKFYGGDLTGYRSYYIELRDYETKEVDIDNIEKIKIMNEKIYKIEVY